MNWIKLIQMPIIAGISGEWLDIGGAESHNLAGISENCWNLRELLESQGNSWKVGGAEFQRIAGISGNCWNFRE
jgi:hypothetical protein